MSKSIVNEFIEKLTRIEGEMKLLGDDRKALMEEYEEKINDELEDLIEQGYTYL